MTRLMQDAAKLAQIRAEGDDQQRIKLARDARRIETVAQIIGKYVSAGDIAKLRKRGCLHVADFPEKHRKNRRNTPA